MGVRTGLPCLLVLTVLVFLSHGSQADNKAKHPSAMVVGTVYCDTCFHQEFSHASHFISGAVVAVECGDDSGGVAAGEEFFRKEARTNDHGVFSVHLPPEIGNHPKKISACSVKLISSSEPFCAVSSSATATATTTPLRRLKSGNKKKKRGPHVFSAGFFSFRPLQQPELCYQKPGPTSATWLRDHKQEAFFMPPNPFRPPSLFPPNPFQPSPPSLLPPNPFQPSPPSLLPPIPGLTPPAPPPFFNIPPIPGLNQPSPPPPAFRFPPFPFPPGFPGVPPAKRTAP